MGVRESITTSLADIKARGQRLVELNIELLKAEIRKKAQEYGGAIGMLVAAGLLSLYALGFLLATIAVVLALWLPTWLALLIVTLVLFLVVTILGLAGRNKLQKLQAAPPPQATAEAKTTIATMRDGAAKTARSLLPSKPARPARPEVAEMPAPASGVPQTPAGAVTPPLAPGADAPPTQEQTRVPPEDTPPPEARS